MTNMPSEVMSTEQVAAYLGVSFGTIRRWIRDGTLPAAKIGRRLFVRECDVQKLLAGTATTSADPPSGGPVPE